MVVHGTVVRLCAGREVRYPRCSNTSAKVSCNTYISGQTIKPPVPCSQPPPETYNLFDDIILLADGATPALTRCKPLPHAEAAACNQTGCGSSDPSEHDPQQMLQPIRCVLRAVAGVIVYHGPRDEVIPFFSSMGFDMPERKGVADFLQEITSRKDQKVRPA